MAATKYVHENKAVNWKHTYIHAHNYLCMHHIYLQIFVPDYYFNYKILPPQLYDWWMPDVRKSACYNTLRFILLLKNGRIMVYWSPFFSISPSVCVSAPFSTYLKIPISDLVYTSQRWYDTVSLESSHSNPLCTQNKSNSFYLFFVYLFVWVFCICDPINQGKSLKFNE